MKRHIPNKIKPTFWFSLYSLMHFYYIHLGVCVCTWAYHCSCLEMIRKLRVPGMELRSPGLAARACPHGAISPAHRYCMFTPFVCVMSPTPALYLYKERGVFSRRMLLWKTKNKGHSLHTFEVSLKSLWPIACREVFHTYYWDFCLAIHGFWGLSPIKSASIHTLAREMYFVING